MFIRDYRSWPSFSRSSIRIEYFVACSCVIIGLDRHLRGQRFEQSTLQHVQTRLSILTVIYEVKDSNRVLCGVFIRDYRSWPSFTRSKIRIEYFVACSYAIIDLDRRLGGQRFEKSTLWRVHTWLSVLTVIYEVKDSNRVLCGMFIRDYRSWPSFTRSKIRIEYFVTCSYVIISQTATTLLPPTNRKCHILLFRIFTSYLWSF